MPGRVTYVSIFGGAIAKWKHENQGSYILNPTESLHKDGDKPRIKTMKEKSKKNNHKIET